MFDDRYVNLNSKKGIRDLISYDFDFFYNDKLILDLPTELINDWTLYKKLTTKLLSKGFNILFKGAISNLFFGIPNNHLRLLIICSKSKDRFNFENMTKISKPYEYISPISLLYGKDINKLENEISKIANNLNIDISTSLNDYKVFSSLSLKNNALDILKIEGNVNSQKFSDGSNKKPSNSKKIRDEIDNADRISMIYPINEVSGKHYYHFNPNRTGCTIREIARLNGYSDDIDLSDINREDFIFIVNNSLSPFVIKNLFHSI